MPNLLDKFFRYLILMKIRRQLADKWTWSSDARSFKIRELPTKFHMHMAKPAHAWGKAISLGYIISHLAKKSMEFGR